MGTRISSKRGDLIIEPEELIGFDPENDSVTGLMWMIFIVTAILGWLYGYYRFYYEQREGLTSGKQKVSMAEAQNHLSTFQRGNNNSPLTRTHDNSDIRDQEDNRNPIDPTDNDSRIDYLDYNQAAID